MVGIGHGRTTAILARATLAEFTKKPLDHLKGFFANRKWTMLKSVHRHLVPVGPFFEIEGQLKLVAAEQTNGLFFGDPIERDFDSIVVPSFTRLELLGAKNPSRSVGLGRILGQNDFGGLRDIQSQYGFDRIIGRAEIEVQFFAMTTVDDHRLGLNDFLSLFFENGPYLESVRFIFFEIAAHEMSLSPGRRGGVSIDEHFGFFGQVDRQVDFVGLDRIAGCQFVRGMFARVGCPAVHRWWSILIRLLRWDTGEFDRMG